MFYPPFKSGTSANTHESEKQDLVDQKIKREIIFFLAEEDLAAENVKKVKVLSWWNSKKTHILPGLRKGIFWHNQLLFILISYFQKLVVGTCINKSEIDCLKKPA